MAGNELFGIVAEFDNPTDILEAARRSYSEGYRRFDVHTPFPIHGMNGAMGLDDSKIPWITLVAGLTGGSLGLLLQYWTSAVDYPLIIGGKPYFSFQAFVPVTFELTILLAALSTVFGMFIINRLPMLYHPLLRYAGFRRASDDRFFISIEAEDPKFDVDRTQAFLEAAGGQNVTVLEA